MYCNIIVTSRPHTTRELEEYFDTIVSVKGFTRECDRKYAFRILRDDNQVRHILNFNPVSSRWDKRSLYMVPILLSFMCYLAKKEDIISLLSKSEQKGFIYYRMIRCLYVSFVEKKKRKFYQSDFVKAMKSVGKLAWQTLLSGNPMFRKEGVIRELGSEIFEWGLLIGDEDPEGLLDETADILVTFAHRSIQEFFGAFYFILRLGEGGSVESLLGPSHQKTIFLTNPLFLEFCLWFLHTSDEICSFLKEVSLVTHIVKLTDRKYLHLENLFTEFPV